VFDPQAIILGLLILVGGLLLFTGSLVAIGAIMPTAKEASQWFSIIILTIFIPLYIMPLIMSDPGASAVQVLLYFPLSAPITALLMNAFGSLSLIQGLIVGIELLIVGILMIKLAVYLFRYGAMSYSNRLSLATISHHKSTLKNL
jgi:ABC-2 type transport system permease protein